MPLGSKRGWEEKELCRVLLYCNQETNSLQSIGAFQWMGSYQTKLEISYLHQSIQNKAPQALF